MLIFQTPTPTAMKPTVILLFAFLSPGVQATEPLPELKPLLGERGAAVLTETFDGPNAKPLDVIPAAKSELAEGAVRLLKRPKAKHPGIAFIYWKEHPPLHDFILEADFRCPGFGTQRVTFVLFRWRPFRAEQDWLPTDYFQARCQISPGSGRGLVCDHRLKTRCPRRCRRSSSCGCSCKPSGRSCGM